MYYMVGIELADRRIYHVRMQVGASDVLAHAEAFSLFFRQNEKADIAGPNSMF